MILAVFFLFGFIQYGASIHCYTCTNFFCSLPVNFDGGDESTENDVDIIEYASDYVCQSIHLIDPTTGEEKLALRGVEHCKESDIINRRISCCNTDNCNRRIPPMTVQTDISSNNQRYFSSNNRRHFSSNNQRYLSSTLLIILSLIFQFLC